MKNKDKTIEVMYYYETTENGTKILKHKALNDYKIYKVIATYGGSHKSEYYVRAFDWKQAKNRFILTFDWLNVLEIEETDLTEEYFNENLRILI
jgi:hypothetical protein